MIMMKHKIVVMNIDTPEQFDWMVKEMRGLNRTKRRSR